jgi:rhodanese-related sulfurtransferase
MLKTITTEKLQLLRKGNEGFLLIDVLSAAQFEQDHIPGARSVPLDTADFAEVVAQKASGGRGRRVVLYGSGQDSDASAKAAAMLVASGFTNVFDYRGGLASWNASKAARRSTGTRT